MYFKGLGIAEDDVQAYVWFSLAASRGDRQAAKYRGTITKFMKPAQIAEAQHLTREWMAAFAKRQTK